eukprot:CAMPEP_0197658286 /NCGR_PEP_ID=MMETSP1338-20131121/45149_1 /TAXON_ID=43686 ORGANISM="Pelagodinium beii, Strain RCC1491" /NCGR_SAMPLE_ID=MMETSP1338 /ASSEMBLY_ACC=CAM_ASM_000754 /LENGTH=144 /DNA_ID=CAMNT_0043234847 /DNA_START=61 /DNA_END=495 /DNA_ORIENTATION=-
MAWLQAFLLAVLAVSVVKGVSVSVDGNGAVVRRQVGLQDVKVASEERLRDDCSGLQSVSDCSETKQSAALCESSFSSSDPGPYRCIWKQSEPAHGTKDFVPSACLADVEAGVCNGKGDASKPTTVDLQKAGVNISNSTDQADKD